jgi:hypothetical protein
MLYKEQNKKKKGKREKGGGGEGKTIPVQDWTGPESSRSLKLPDFSPYFCHWLEISPALVFGFQTSGDLYLPLFNVSALIRKNSV